MKKVRDYSFGTLVKYEKIGPLAKSNSENWLEQDSEGEVLSRFEPTVTDSGHVVRRDSQLTTTRHRTVATWRHVPERK